MYVLFFVSLLYYNFSGEAAFKAMSDQYGWPKYPMMYRLNSLDWRIPITFIYGSRSWFNRQPGLQIKYSRLNSYVDVQVCLIYMLVIASFVIICFTFNNI